VEHTEATPVTVDAEVLAAEASAETPATDIPAQDANTPTGPALAIGITFYPESGHIQMIVPDDHDPLMVFQILNQVTQAQLAGLTNELVGHRRRAMTAPAIVPAKPGDVVAIAGSLRAFRNGH
jgi:hypothetical protein